MMKNPPNSRPQNPDTGDFADDLADLQNILYRSVRSGNRSSGHQDHDRLEDLESDNYPEHGRYSEPPQQPNGRRHPDNGRYADAGRQDPRQYPVQDHAEDLDSEYADYDPDEPVPPFLSDGSYDQQYSERLLMKRRSTISLRILVGVLVAAGAAVLFALLTSDTTRAVIANAKTSISGGAAEPASLPSDAGRLTMGDMQLKDPTRMSTPPPAAPPARSTVASTNSFVTATVPPSREEMTSAYQGNFQARPPIDDSPVASPVIRRLDQDELVMLMRRAKSLLAAGDIPSARLLLERAANAQDPTAALMLAQTYDYQVLGTKDTRKIKSDPETARAWYQRAAQLGSIEAQRRLSQLQN